MLKLVPRLFVDPAFHLCADVPDIGFTAMRGQCVPLQHTQQHLLHGPVAELHHPEVVARQVGRHVRRLEPELGDDVRELRLCRQRAPGRRATRLWEIGGAAILVQQHPVASLVEIVEPAPFEHPVNA